MVYKFQNYEVHNAEKGTTLNQLIISKTHAHTSSDHAKSHAKFQTNLCKTVERERSCAHIIQIVWKAKILLVFNVEK